MASNSKAGLAQKVVALSLTVGLLQRQMKEMKETIECLKAGHASKSVVEPSVKEKTKGYFMIDNGNESGYEDSDEDSDEDGTNSELLAPLLQKTRLHPAETDLIAKDLEARALLLEEV